MVGDLFIVVSFFLVVVVGEFIYIFGGEKNDRKDIVFI